MAENKKPKTSVVARGKAIRRTDEELDDATSAEAMEKLAADAAADWRENAKPAYSTLLDSEVKE